MKNIKVVIGANFGDEGKGLMTDFYCSSFPMSENVLNVRFNGGAQAGHTVVHPDGRRHIFSHFGSGSFNNNVHTYLSAHFIVNPILFHKEWVKLEKLGVNPQIFINKDCKVTFPCDMMINQIVERNRSGSKHGSCGVGIYETIHRNNFEHTYTVEDIVYNPSIFANYLLSVANDYSINRLKELGVVNIFLEDVELLNNKIIIENFIADVQFMLDNSVLVDEEEILSRYDNVVFEGAQGLLLDKDNKEYFPHLTPTNTGVSNILKLIRDKDYEVCYVTRSYLTRHGAGKFKSECEKNEIRKNIVDMTNHFNEFQGDFRYGYFDPALLNWSIEKEVLMGVNPDNIVICVTHLDETDTKIIVDHSKTITLDKLSQQVDYVIKYEADGVTRNHITVHKS